jgi:hypothetical protein
LNGRKIIAFSVDLIVITSLLLTSLNAATAASTSKLAVPEFTLNLVNRPYDVPPTTTVDPYTGNTVTIGGSYHAENTSIDVIINNQPFTPYTVNDSEVHVYFQVQFKGHYGDNWQLYSYSNLITPIQLTYYNVPSNGDYTVISIPLKNEGTQVGSVTNFPEDGQVDIQVRALIGYLTVTTQWAGIGTDWVNFNGETSNWSNTQTINLKENTNTTPTPTSTVTPQPTLTPLNTVAPTQNPQATPTQPDIQADVLSSYDWIKIALTTMALAIAGLSVGLVLLWHKTKTT